MKPRVQAKGAVAVFGGSFNPIHAGHVELIRKIQERFSFNPLYVVPCGIQPRKGALEHAPEARLEMTSEAVREIAGVRVSDFEIQGAIKTTEPSYSLTTIKHFKDAHPGRCVFFILGEDAFAKIEGWHGFPEILSACGFIVVRRKGAGASEKARAVARAHPSALVRFVDLDLPAISASEIRAKRKI
ncbi:MAG: nicotinate (nicotinamide) nucleotide adenylyltransferase [Deltaproteobacteria bacterium]|nr:nicotinate (nicotinamide) nucleotide adenylyltransferase [Deltaproteobacteria bacterium]